MILDSVCKCLILLLQEVIYWISQLFYFSLINIDVNEPFYDLDVLLVLGLLLAKQVLLSQQFEYISLSIEIGDIFNVLYWNNFDESDVLELNFIDCNKFHYLSIMSLKLSIINNTFNPFLFNYVLKFIAFNVNMYTPTSVGF